MRINTSPGPVNVQLRLLDVIVLILVLFCFLGFLLFQVFSALVAALWALCLWPFKKMFKRKNHEDYIDV
jgi:Na+/H+ antiporter NhaD/arsenite permease-like protein